MKTRLLFLVLILATFNMAKAQYPAVTIEDIQTVTPTALGNCDDQTFYLGDTVIIRAKVVMDGNLAVPSGASIPNGHKNFWLQQGNGGPYKGLDVFQFSSLSVSEDPHNLIAGDSIEIIGYIEDYNGETEIVPLEGSSITLLGQGQPITPVQVSIADLNDIERNNLLETGEQWEGSYVEIVGATVASLDFFSGGSRVSFNIEDQFGNLLGVSDRFLVQKLPGQGGNFVAPNVGDQLDTIRGVIAHSKNNCPGFNGRGYELYPFQESDYVYGASAPRIFNIARTPLVPSSSQDVAVTADISDNDGVIVSASISYATGASGGSFSTVPMTFVSGETYTATIPAQADGTLVRWYITATDDSAQVTQLPNNDPTTNTYLYRVRNNGLSIFDVQYTPYSNGVSPYLGQTVSVEGVVTSSVNSSDTGDLGYVYIQQENQLNFAGLWLQQGSTISQLERGQKVEVEGVVRENFGMTALSDIASVSVTGTGSINPVVLNPDSFSVYNGSTQEQYEGMLVRFENPTAGDRIYVVEQNADAVTSNNYAEYRVGTDVFNPNSGVRVIAGRSAGNSSLYVSYVNDSTWINNLNVDPYVVDYGHSMQSVSGIFYYSFGAMKLLPRNNHDVVGYGDAPVMARFTSDLVEVCVNDTVQFFNMSSIIADDFSWDFGDGTNSSMEDPMQIYTVGGWYNVSLIATNSVDGASDTASAVEYIYVDSSEACSSVGIAEKQISAVETLVYPNPTSEMITIKTDFTDHTVYSITIYDLNGREIFKRVTMRSIETLNLSSLDAGNYILEVNANGSTVDVMQIVKQ